MSMLLDEPVTAAAVVTAPPEPPQPEPDPDPVPAPPPEPTAIVLPELPADAPADRRLARAMALYIIEHPGCMVHGPVALDLDGKRVEPEWATAVQFCMVGLASRVSDGPGGDRTLDGGWGTGGFWGHFRAWGGPVSWYEGDGAHTPGDGALVPGVVHRRRTTAETLGVLVLLAQGKPVPSDA